MTPEIAVMLAILVIVVVLMVTEALRIDVIALLLMVALPWIGVIEPQQALSGLASNAVVAIIAVMVLSRGLDRAGVMRRVTRPILRAAGSDPRRVTTLLTTAAAILSGLMQNVGSAALLLPATLRIARRTGIPAGRLLLPVGYVAILGGTLTLVGSGPLIILNDLLGQSGEEPFGLFSVTPVGLALVVCGILYFMLFGDMLLSERGGDAADESSVQQALVETWELPATTRGVAVPSDSPLVGKTVEEARFWDEYGLNLLALEQDEDTTYAPWRRTRFAAGQRLTLLGADEEVKRFAGDHGLDLAEEGAGEDGARFAEVIVPPRSPVADRSLRQLSLRRTWGVEPIVLLNGNDQRRADFSDVPLKIGDVLVVYGPPGHLRSLRKDGAFVPVSPIAEGKPQGSHTLRAMLCALTGVGLALAGAHLAVSLLTGAVAMILLRVLPIDEVYDAIDWRTVFLLAGLMPLGVAMQETGAARFLADAMLALPHGGNALVIMGGIALLATAFSLVMSNVGATVLLVPLVLALGESVGVSGRALALLVGVATANSFILPTHQVNALLMGPGNYRTRDYLKAGSLLTLLFLVIAVGLIHVLYVAG